MIIIVAYREICLIKDMPTTIIIKHFKRAHNTYIKKLEEKITVFSNSMWLIYNVIIAYQKS